MVALLQGIDDEVFVFREDLRKAIRLFDGSYGLRAGLHLHVSYADAGQMHLYLNYAREHWMKEGENPPVGLILCSEKGTAEAHYALDNLPNKVLAAEYQMVLPEEKLIADELNRTSQQLAQRKKAI
jgi:hypothetical protein